MYGERIDAAATRFAGRGHQVPDILASYVVRCRDTGHRLTVTAAQGEGDVDLFSVSRPVQSRPNTIAGSSARTRLRRLGGIRRRCQRGVAIATYEPSSPDTSD